MGLDAWLFIAQVAMLSARKPIGIAKLTYDFQETVAASYGSR
jgi:hypothetical protein